jgi:hypothetical protein
LIEAIVDPSPSNRLQVVEDIGRDRESALDALDALTEWFLTGERARHGLAHPPAPEFAIDHVTCVRWLDAIRETRRAILGNAHVQIALEELLLLEGR